MVKHCAPSSPVKATSAALAVAWVDAAQVVRSEAARALGYFQVVYFRLLRTW